MNYDRKNEFEAVLRGLGKSPNTIRAYHADLSKLLPMISEYSDSAIQGAILSLSENGASPSSLKRLLSTVKTYCNIFEIHVNFTRIGSPKIPYRESSYIKIGRAHV